MSHLFGCSILFVIFAIFVQQGVIQAATAIAVDVACNTTNGDTCATGLACEKNVCKYKNGTACDNTHQNSCVDGATCTAPGDCTCAAGRLPVNTADGTCAVGVGGNCSGGKACATGLVCEDDHCKIKDGATCTGNTDKCVDGATCEDVTAHNCVCGAGRTPATAQGTCPVAVGGNCSGGKVCATNLFCENDLCKIKVGASCTSNTDKCIDGATCGGTSPICSCGTGTTPDAANERCLVAVGGDCSGGKACETDLVCENDHCKIKNGVSCGSNTDKCVDGATCDATLHNCVCGAGRTPATAQGRCAEVKVGGVCITDASCLANGVCGGDKKCGCKTSYVASDDNSTCVAVSNVGGVCQRDVECLTNGECSNSKTCICKTNYAASSDKSKCVNNGAASLLASSLLLVVGVFVTSRLL